ncbi:hypothetical protein PoB_002074900 [Plakobranchus ocellatus]|uniref:Uncharacterized protein n=1 Tax=Plakobranchus ocellatus TaxID=259542 RepID=A0AAV3ZFX2_9GAST|nr:hypothetical protein PoB_002074900 [Plakobranchus ocellatus]
MADQAVASFPPTGTTSEVITGRCFLERSDQHRKNRRCLICKGDLQLGPRTTDSWGLTRHRLGQFNPSLRADIFTQMVTQMKSRKIKGAVTLDNREIPIFPHRSHRPAYILYIETPLSSNCYNVYGHDVERQGEMEGGN